MCLQVVHSTSAHAPCPGLPFDPRRPALQWMSVSRPKIEDQLPTRLLAHAHDLRITIRIRPNVDRFAST